MFEETDVEVFPPGEGSGSDLTDVPETTSTPEKHHGAKSNNLMEVKLAPHLAKIPVEHTT